MVFCNLHCIDTLAFTLMRMFSLCVLYTDTAISVCPQSDHTCTTTCKGLSVGATWYNDSIERCKGENAMSTIVISLGS